MKKTIVITFLSLLCCLFSFAVLASCGEDNGVTSGNPAYDAQFSVVYSYEKLSGGRDYTTVVYGGESGKLAEAPAFGVVGYTLDTASADYVPSGVVTGDGKLVLGMPYKLVESVVSVNKAGSGSVTIGAERYKFGERVSFTAVAADGYVVSSSSVKKTDGTEVRTENGSFIMPETDVVVNVVFSADENVFYKTEHWCMAADGSDYELYFSERIKGTAGQTATAVPLSDAGFIEKTDHPDRNASGTVAADDSLVLKLYYDRAAFSVTAKAGSAFTVDKTGPFRYGDEVIVSTENGEPGYRNAVKIYSVLAPEKVFPVEYVGGKYVFKMPSCDVTAEVYAAPEKVPYVVRLYAENLEDDGYSVFKLYYGTADAGSDVTVATEPVAGYVFDEDNANNVMSGRISGDGSSVFAVYYLRNENKVDYYDADGSVMRTERVKTGMPLPEPEGNNYLSKQDKYYYNRVNGEMYEKGVVVTGDTVVERVLFDGEISTKEEFYEVFGAVDKNDGSGYMSDKVVSGSYILMSDIDFGGDYIQLGGLSGYIEGNGYSMKNINVCHGWMSTVMNSSDSSVNTLIAQVNGTIRNISFENVIFTPGRHGYERTQLGATGYAGLLIGKFGGTLENVYVGGKMRGVVYSEMSWDGNSYFATPNDNDEGKPVAGAVVYSSEGGTFRNVVVDVASEYTFGNSTTLSLVAGKGLFKADNVFVVAADSENTSGRTITRGLTAADIGIDFGTYAEIGESLEAALGEVPVWNVEALVNGQPPLNINAFARSKFRQYAVNHRFALGSSSVPGELSGYTLYRTDKLSATAGSLTEAKVVSVYGFEAGEVVQKAVADDDSTEVDIFYARDMLVETFEQYPLGECDGGRWNWQGNISSFDSVNVVSQEFPQEVPHVVNDSFEEVTWANNAPNTPYDGDRCMRFLNCTNAIETIRYYLTAEMIDALRNGGTMTFAIKMTGYTSYPTTFVINGKRDWKTKDANAFHKYKYNTDGYDIWQNYNAKSWGVLTVGTSSISDIIEKGYMEIKTNVERNFERGGYAMWLDNITVKPA